jgi:hypothetical protein
MSENLLNTYVTGFDRSIRETVEVKGGKLRPYIQLATGDLYREEGVYQRTTGGGLPQKKTNRFGDSPVSELDYSRRRVTRAPFEDGQFMDWADVVRMGTDPRSNKLTAMRNKFLRQEDIILDQAMLGIAKGGDNGETNVEFGEYGGSTDQNIVDITLGAAAGVTTAGFNYEKFLSALETFGTGNVDLEAYTPVFKLSYKQWQDMMQDDKFINFDYTGAAPIDGMRPTMVKDYMGCKFLFTNIVPYVNTSSSIEGDDFNVADTDINTTLGTWTDTDSTDVRACYAFVQDAALLEINPDITTDIDKRADKGFNWYAYLKMDLGAVRMEEEKVVAIPCDQSPA